MDMADYRLSVDGPVEVCNPAAEMLHQRHEQAIDERNMAEIANLALTQTAVELGRIDKMVERYAPWTAGCDTVAGRVHAVLIRLERLERLERRTEQ